MKTILHKYKMLATSAALILSMGGAALPAMAQLPAGVANLGLPFGIEPTAIGGVGLGLVSGIALEDGLGAVPLIGSDLEIVGTPEGALAALLALATEQQLPIGLPVIGRKPQKLYGSVLLALLGTYGVPVNGIAFPIPMP